MGLRATGVGPGEKDLRPIVRELDPSTGRIVRELAPRASHPPPDGDQATAAFCVDGVLWQPTRTAIHRVDLETWRSEQVLTHPLFHDVHSIAPGRVPGRWLVTCTGHESVLEISEHGEVHERWSLGKEPPPSADLRERPHDAFKPHAVHPNRAFVLEGRVWATCLDACACVGLGHAGRWDLGPGRPHDGVLREGLVWFTTTRGGVIGLEPSTGRRVVELDLAGLEGASGAFGWARGIEVVGERLWVGVTVLRASRWRETARRVLGGRREPTRVLEVDWKAGRLLRRFEVGEDGEGVIYGVLATPS